MSFFSTNYAKPGPGIDKDAPPKKGLALFFDVYIRAFWELIKLNLLFLLFCVPVITIGPACAGMSRVTMLMMRERPFFVWGDFWKGFKQEFKQSFITGLLLAVVTTGLVFGICFYFAAAAQNNIFYAAWFMLLVAGFMLSLSCIYLYPLIVTVKLPLFTLYKNAMLLGIVCLKQSLPALIIIFVLVLAMLLLLPFTVPVLFLMFFSFVGFICSFSAWPGIKTHVVSKAQKEQEA